MPGPITRTRTCHDGPCHLGSQPWSTWTIHQTYGPDHLGSQHGSQHGLPSRLTINSAALITPGCASRRRRRRKRSSPRRPRPPRGKRRSDVCACGTKEMARTVGQTGLHHLFNAAAREAQVRWVCLRDQRDGTARKGGVSEKRGGVFSRGQPGSKGARRTRSEEPAELRDQRDGMHGRADRAASSLWVAQWAGAARAEEEACGTKETACTVERTGLRHLFGSARCSPS